MVNINLHSVVRNVPSTKKTSLSLSVRKPKSLIKAMQTLGRWHIRTKPRCLVRMLCNASPEQISVSCLNNKKRNKTLPVGMSFIDSRYFHVFNWPMEGMSADDKGNGAVFTTCLWSTAGLTPSLRCSIKSFFTCLRTGGLSGGWWLWEFK